MIYILYINHFLLYQWLFTTRLHHTKIISTISLRFNGIIPIFFVSLSIEPLKYFLMLIGMRTMATVRHNFFLLNGAAPRRHTTISARHETYFYSVPLKCMPQAMREFARQLMRTNNENASLIPQKINNLISDQVNTLQLFAKKNDFCFFVWYSAKIV